VTAECKDIQARVHQSCRVMVHPFLLRNALLRSALPPREQRRRTVILGINLRKRLEVSRLCCAALGGTCGRKEGEGRLSTWRGYCSTWQALVADAGTPGGVMRPRSCALVTTSCPTCIHVLALSSATHGRPQIVATANDAHPQTWRAPSPMQ